VLPQVAPESQRRVMTAGLETHRGTGDHMNTDSTAPSESLSQVAVVPPPRDSAVVFAPPLRQAQTVRLSGRFDVRSVGELRSCLYSAIDCGTGTLRVDVAGLELVDHAGLGVLLGGTRRARRIGRSMLLVNIPAALSSLLEAHRLSRILRLEEVPELLHIGHA
jgi:anti-anti-sigma factor